MAPLRLVIVNKIGRRTFHRLGASSVLDLTMVSLQLVRRVTFWMVLDKETLSDHQHIQFTLGGISTEVRAPPLTGWKVKEMDSKKLKEAILETSSTLAENASPSDAVDAVTRMITAACDRSAPRTRRPRRRRQQAYWWSSEIVDLRKDANAERRCAQRSRKQRRPTADADAGTYRQAKRKLRYVIWKSKQRCWRALCDMVNDDPWGTSYGVVMSTLLSQLGFSAPTDRATLLNIVDALFLKGQARITFPDPVAETIPPFDQDEFRLATRRLENGEAPGLDGIPNEALKLVIESRSLLILELFNRCLMSGSFPRQWKRQRLVLIPKGKGGDPNAASSNRPLSMLEDLGKLYERMIPNRFVKAYGHSGGLLFGQYGFREGLSTLHAIQAAQNAMERTFNLIPELAGYCAIVLLDVENAFNSAS